MKYIKIAFLIIATSFLSSCLTSGLDDLPTYSDAEIINVKFEYRWSVKEGTSDKLRVKMMVTDYEVNNSSNTVTCSVTVPAADGEFTEAVRSNVVLSDIIAYTTISSAASIIPEGSSPALGTPGDWTSTNTYTVRAANGDSKTWTIEVSEFNK
ncbi:hypothetical protein SAMN06265379_10128 [Saccharicrinis carchari]|uniref:DUF5018 domain-containing protein n=1 Tax=Saccharicrinis carchari TaxID=1168039 RepID=A0A521ACA8_SACCC|nr:hypothetical protein [Saccharicrinis carchari]SMO32464.1 hypothetical protein SAMN06265379_10128 [Saccharicrinis carchari]